MPLMNWYHMTKSVMLHSPFHHLNIPNEMMPLMTLTPASMLLHGPKSYVAHCFNQLGVMNTMVLLAVLLTSHAGDASAKCHMTDKSSCIFLFLIILH